MHASNASKASNAPAVVVGGGHNGLVAACYLAKAGRPVLVLEASDKLGGGSRTDETIRTTGSTPTRPPTTSST
jgi:protoporphyrinogen oxidase